MNKPTSKSNERPMVSEELQVQNTEQEQRQRPENGNTRRWWTTGPRHTTVDDRGPRDSSRDYRRARGTTEDHGGESMAVVRQPAPAGGLPPPASIPAQSPEGVDCAWDRFRCPASPCPWGTAITAQGSCRRLCATQSPGPQNHDGSASQLRCTSTLVGLCRRRPGSHTLHPWDTEQHDPSAAWQA